MVIELKGKFTSKHLNNFLKLYGDVNNIKELKKNLIIDFSKLEWIAVEEVVFIIAWLRKLRQCGIKFKIILANLSDTTTKSARTTINLWHRWDLNKFQDKMDYSYYGYESNINSVIKKEQERDLELHNDNKQYSIIPFKILKKHENVTLSEIRNEIRNGIENVYSLQKEVENLLNKEGCMSPFENETISNIITVELYLNTLLHAFNKNDINKECYLAIAVNHKQDPEKYKLKWLDNNPKKNEQDYYQSFANRIKGNFESEFSIEEQNFYRRESNPIIGFGEMNDEGRHKFNLKMDYENQSYINFSFLDFGQGIVNTLKQNYLSDKDNDWVQNQMSNLDTINEDARILEYACLLHSSKDPVSEKLIKNGFVPRGLYFVVEYVKRYCGQITVRSGSAKIVYNFKNNNKQIKDCVQYVNENSGYLFGTLISITLPSNTNISLKAVEFNHEGIFLKHIKNKRVEIETEIISIQSIIRKIVKSKPELREQMAESTHTCFLYQELFEVIQYHLNYRKENNYKKRILIFDFEFLDKNFLDQKLYYFICQNPSINSLNNVIIINPPSQQGIKGIQGILLDKKYDSIRPVPVIFSNNEVIWIGIKNLEFETILNTFWIQDPKPNIYKTSFVSSVKSEGDQIQGNLIEFDDFGEGNLKTFCFPNLEDLWNIIRNHEKDYVNKLLDDSSNNILLTSDTLNDRGELQKRIFETSGKYYQNEFISYLGKFLNKENLSSLYQISTIEKFANIFINRLIREKGELQKIGATKIVAVTLSSHILAEEICDIYNSYVSSKENAHPLRLIKLTNYFEFIKEEEFHSITKEDKVIIVNDVISTGSLNKKLHDSISKICEVICIFSISDTRTQLGSVEHIFDDKIQELLICIHEDKEVVKYQSKEEIIGFNNSYKVVKVNSVLNAPTSELEKSSKVKRKVLYNGDSEDSQPLEFLKLIEECSEDSLIVGHYARSKTHQPYFINTKKLFNTVQGKHLLQQMFDKLIKLDNNATKERNVGEFTKLKNRISRIVDSKSFSEIEKNYLKSVYERFKDMERGQNVIYEENYRQINIDYILHASDSGFDLVSKNDFDNFLNKTDIKLIRMPRISSNDDWAIPNIPIEYKNIFEKKDILILESATTTGETLLNLIDSMCYLEVKKIIVFSVVSRLREDQEEFLSRIHKINNNYSSFPENSIPIDVYFGAHFNLPQYLADSHECPHCSEIFNYQRILAFRDIPKPVKGFIKSSIKFLKKIDNKSYDYENKSVTVSEYLPKGIFKYKMFYLRDILAKREKQKIRNKYFANSVDNAQEILNDDENLDELLAVLLHEPHLVNILREFFDTVFINIKGALFSILEVNSTRSRRLKFENYAGNVLFLSHYFYKEYDREIGTHTEIIKDELYEGKFLDSIISYVEKIKNEKEFEHCLNFIAFVIWKEFTDSKYFRNKYNDSNPKIDHYLNDEYRIRYLINYLESTCYRSDLKFETRKMIYQMLLSLVTYDIYELPLTPKRASDGIKDIFIKNELEGNDHNNFAGVLSKAETYLGLFPHNTSQQARSLSIFLSYWNENVVKTLQRFSEFLKYLEPFIRVSDVDNYYQEIYIDYSIENLISKVLDLRISQDLFEKSSEIQNDISDIKNYYFQNNTSIKRFLTFQEICLKKRLLYIKKKLSNLNEPISVKTNLDIEETKIESHEFVIEYILFSELEKNLHKYAKNVEFTLRVENNCTILQVKNEKKKNEKKLESSIFTLNSTLHGEENWKSHLKDYGISILREESENNYSVIFKFN